MRSAWSSVAGKGVRVLVAGLVLALTGATAGWTAGAPLGATIVDRQGNVYHVKDLTYSGRDELSFYYRHQRRTVPLRAIKSVRFEGGRGDERQRVVITLYGGKVQTGTMETDVNVAPAENAVGGSKASLRFAGTTDLGPFSISVSDVREIVIEHPPGQAPVAVPELRATIVTVDGKRFDLTHVECRGSHRLYYQLGQRRRFVDLEKVARIDFAEGSSNEEQRPVTITYWSGKTIQGTVEASRVRLSGETDRAFYERVNAAWTGRTSMGGAFSVGMHAVKQIRFKRPDEGGQGKKKAETQEKEVSFAAGADTSGNAEGAAVDTSSAGSGGGSAERDSSASFEPDSAAVE